MDGWSEQEIRNQDLMAPCGLYCGACGISQKILYAALA